MYKKSAKGWLKHVDFIILDQLCLQLAFLAAYCIRHGATIPYINVMYRNMAIVLALLQVMVVFFGDCFSGVLRRGYYREFTVSVKSVCMVMLLMTCYLFATQEGDAYSRTTLFLTGGLYLCFTYPARIIWKRFTLKKGIGRNNKRSLIILTSSDMTDIVVENIKSNSYEGYLVTGIALLDKNMTGKVIESIPVVADKETVLEYVSREWVDEVFINLPKEMPIPEDIMKSFAEMGVTIHLNLAQVVSMKGRKQLVERLGKYTVLTTSVNIATPKQLFYKRSLDLLGGFIGCVLTGILCIFVAPAIYIKSPGPVFFSQVRVGKGGKKFKMYKFRSMYMDAEERKKELMEKNKIQDGMMFKMDDDPRIIGGKRGIGGFIRALSIDEFPQFFNVLKGDMSLVGTRPPTLDEWEKYELHHRARLAIKPGITGMWQVSGRSDITDFEEVVKLDTEYIENWTIGLDIKILMKTVLAVLKSDGAQ